MSVPVAVEALKERIAECGDGAFLITVNADGRAHVVSVAPRVEGDGIVLAAGSSSRANVAANPSVTLLWPRSPDGSYSLIVDGVATTDSQGEVVVTPSRAVLHRLADAIGDGPKCVPVEGPPS